MWTPVLPPWPVPHHGVQAMFQEPIAAPRPPTFLPWGLTGPGSVPPLPAVSGFQMPSSPASNLPPPSPSHHVPLGPPSAMERGPFTPATSIGSHPAPWLLTPPGRDMPPQIPPSATKTPGGPKRTPRPAFRTRVEREREIKTAFQAIDIDDSGEVDYDAVLLAIESLEIGVTKAEVHNCMRQMGLLSESYFNFDTFRELLLKVYSHRQPLQAVLDNFKLLDRKQKGHINIKDLRQLVTSSTALNGLVSEDDLDQMIHFFDADGDGAVSQEDFVQIVGITGLE